MGAFADFLQTGPAADAAPVEETPGQFKRGLRSGLYGAGSQLEALAGGAAEAAGASDFARDRYAASGELQDQAQAAAPRVNSYKDVLAKDGSVGGSIRNAYDYVTGLLGQSVPSTALALGGALAARTPAGRVVGSTLATAPMEVGDVVQRQQADPVSLRAGAGERLFQAAESGLASAALQSAVPAIVAGKIAGPASKTAASKSVKAILGDGLADAGLESVTEGAGEAAKQIGHMASSPDTKLDTGAIAENAVGGLAAGGALGAAGVGGELVHKGLAAPGRLRGTFTETVDKGKDFLARVANGEDVADVKALIGQTPEKIKEALPRMDAERMQTMQQMASDLLSKAGVAPEVQERIKAAAADLGDKANQAVVAKAKQGWDATEELRTQAKTLYDSVADTVKNARGIKKSEDYSGLRAAIEEHVLPALPAYALQGVNAQGQTEAINHTADALRMLIERAASPEAKPIGESTLRHLTDLFGDKTLDVLEGVHSAVRAQPDPAELERFAATLNRVAALQQRDSDIVGEMKKSLVDGVSANDAQLRQVAQHLREYFDHGPTGTEQAKLLDHKVRFELKKFFGDKEDVVMSAIEKDFKANRPETALGKDRTAVNEDGTTDLKDASTRLAEREAGDLAAEPVYYGRKNDAGRTEGLSLHPDKDPAKEKGQAVQALARAEKENPDRSVSFITARELGEGHPFVQAKMKELLAEHLATDPHLTVEQATALVKKEIRNYGIVAAEGTRQEIALTKDDAKSVSMQGDDAKAKTSHLKHPSRLQAEGGGQVYDAVKLTKLMDKRQKEYSASDNKGAGYRTARMFLDGLAALQDHLGKIVPVSDSTVIGMTGTGNITWGDVKGLDMSPRNGKGVAEKASAVLEKLRDEYKSAKADGATKETLDKITKKAKAVTDEAENKKAAELTAERPDKDNTTDDGRQEPDPFGNVHALGNKVEPVHTNITGNSKVADQGTTGKRLTDAEVKTLREKFEAMGKVDSAAAKAIARKAGKLLDNVDVLNKSAHRSLFGLLAKGTRPSDAASVVNALTDKYANQFKSEAKPKAEAKPAYSAEEIDRRLAKGDFNGIENEAQMDAFLIEAAKRVVELRAEDKRVLWDDEHPTNELPAKEKAALYALEETFREHNDLGVYYEFGDKLSERSDDDVRAMLLKAVPALSERARASKQATDPSAKADDATREAVRDYIEKVLGKTVTTEFKNLPHAGEFERINAEDIVRISVHALNPLSAAHHEALHAFFVKLFDQGNTKVGQALERAAMSAPVQNQLKKLLAGEPAALKQLTDPEESAAYMYQFWAAGKLTLGDGAKTVFQRISDALKKVLGIWTHDQRALAIMEYFHSGQFAANMNSPSAVAAALVNAGHNQAIQKARGFAKPLTDLADAVATASGQRLRDTGIPALAQLADVMKAEGTAKASDIGFIQAARSEHARVMNELAEKLAQFTPAQLNDAMEAAQKGMKAATPEGRLAQRAIQGPNGMLPRMWDYMKAAGVDLANVQPKPDYFPRLWDAGYIASHQPEFLAMMAKYPAHDARAIMQRLMANEGAEFNVEVDKPGMQHLKQRVLDFIDPADAAPFVNKSLYETLNSYAMQATRRAEWARRLGDDGMGVVNILAKAKAQGATPEQIATAEKFVRAVDGTLGDSIDPQVRRLMGNMIVYQNIRLLPLAIFSSVVDPLGISVRGGTVGDAWSTFKRGIKEVALNFKKDVGAKDADTKFAELVGTIDSASLMHTIGTSYSQGMVGSTGRKVNDLFFRYNLMDQFNRSMRIGATQAALSFLKRHADGTASEHSERWMAELGYAPGEYKDGVLDDKAKAAINRWVDGAVLRPDAVDKPIWMSDPRWMLVSHLKQFVYSFHQTILKRVAHEAKNGNYAPAMALASYVPVMIASDAIKGLIQGAGDTPQWKKDWEPADYVWNGVERGGLLGVGQFAVDMGQDIHRGGVGVGALAGPTIEQFADAVRMTGHPTKPESFALHALPANTLYAGFLKGAGGGQADPKFAD